MKKPTLAAIKAALHEDNNGDQVTTALQALGFSVEDGQWSAPTEMDDAVWIMPYEGTRETERVLVWSDRGARTSWTTTTDGLVVTARRLLDGWWASDRKTGTAKGANREAVLACLTAASRRGEALTREQIAASTGLDATAVSNVLYSLGEEGVSYHAQTRLYTALGYRVVVTVEATP
jgi:hypothetical protein